MRKALFVIMLTGLLVPAAQAQRLKAKNLPPPVAAAFTQIFPQMGKVKWEREKTNFEAEFKENGLETSAVFDGTGKLLEKETEIPTTALPAAVQATLAAEYAGWEIEETVRLERNGQTFYEAEVEKGKEEFVLVFDASGKVVEKMGEDDED